MVYDMSSKKGEKEKTNKNKKKQEESKKKRRKKMKKSLNFLKFTAICGRNTYFVRNASIIDKQNMCSYFSEFRNI